MASVKSPVKIGNFLQFSGKTLQGEKIDFSQYEGKVVLVVNVASL
jgi:glutathione peroxidase-family protein